MAKTLLEIKTEARERADMVGSNFISTTELTNYANASYKEVYDIVVSANQDYFTTSSTFTISSGNTSSLPSDFYKLRAIDYKYGAVYRPIDRFNFNERGKGSNLADYGYSNHKEYRIVGSNIHIEPDQNATGDYKLWYIPTVTALSADGDATVLFDSWDEFIIIDIAIKMLAKEESSTTALEKEKAIVMKRIIDSAVQRDLEGTESIKDTSEYNYWDI